MASIDFPNPLRAWMVDPSFVPCPVLPGGRFGRASLLGARHARHQQGSAAEVFHAEPISASLDPDNRVRVARGCTLATSANEVLRHDGVARRAHADQVEALASELERHRPLADPERRARALEAVALCVGGIGIARATGDEELAREVLGVCRERAIAAISDEGGA